MNKKEYVNFWNYYISNVFPRFQQIDILLKTKCGFIHKKIVENLLLMKSSELQNILESQNIKCITYKNFLKIMLCGNSYICSILKREIEKNTYNKYSAEDLAYIYNIDYEYVKKAFDFLEKTTVSSEYFQAVFIQINQWN